MSDTPKFLTVRDFTARYAIGRSTLYNMVAEGKLRAVKAGGRTLLDMKSAEAWADSLPSAAINFHTHGKGAAALKGAA